MKVYLFFSDFKVVGKGKTFLRSSAEKIFIDFRMKIAHVIEIAFITKCRNFN